MVSTVIEFSMDCYKDSCVIYLSLFNIQRNFLQMTYTWSKFRELKTSKCSVLSGVFISNLCSQGSAFYENWEWKDCKGQN